jgi:Flp pilus assembly protein TadD
MFSKRMFLGVCLAAAFLGFAGPLAADTYPVILHGKVVMQDGSPPPVIMGIERVCSDVNGSRPGTLTDKKGEYIWRMEIDPLETRDCKIRATHAGYSSTQVEVSGIDTTHTTLDLPPIVVSTAVADPYAIMIIEGAIPGRAKKDWDEAMKALDAPAGPDSATAALHLEAAVAASPKYGPGWHALGVVDERLKKFPEARAAYEHAVESAPKLLPPYVALLRVCIKLKDWDGAEKAAAALLKADPKHIYPEVYLHQAVAKYGLKDYNGAQESVEEAIRLDAGHKRPRAEYVLGRILEAKGDTNGAKEHMAMYLKLDPAPPDVDLVKGHLELMGKPGAADVDPQLEPL